MSLRQFLTQKGDNSHNKNSFADGFTVRESEEDQFTVTTIDVEENKG